MGRRRVDMTYKRKLKPITQQDVDRFWSKVDIREPDECWNWQLKLTKHGYGLFAAGGTLHRCTRFAYVHRNGLQTHHIPKDLRINAKCGNKACCNPAHLQLFNHQEIWDKMAEDGKIVVGSKHRMSKLTEQDILDIRERYTPKSLTDNYQRIADDYGVTPGCIRDIIIRKTWRHV